MRKKILFAIVPLILLACNFLFPASPKPDSAPSTLSTPQALDSSTASFVIVRIEKSNGSMMKQLAAEAQKANKLGLAPFIEFDATWCPPCQAVEKSIEDEDPLTMQALKGVYLVRADVDEWSGSIGKDFNFDAIPVYYQLDENGNPTGAVIDGGAWGEDIPKNFAPVLDEFFHAK
jgi:thiol:disulfide interchange protein